MRKGKGESYTGTKPETAETAEGTNLQRRGALRPTQYVRCGRFRNSVLKPLLSYQPMRYFPLIYTVCLFHLLGCDQEPRKLQHPISDNLDLPKNLLISVAHSRELNDPSANILSAFDAIDETDTVGALELEDGRVIGRIATAVLHEDRIYVLDDRLNRISVFLIDGTFIRHISNPGPGPGELSIPRGLHVSDDELLVGDERRVVHRFEKTDRTWTFVRDIPINFLAFDLCAVDDHLFVLGVSEENKKIIHKLVDGVAVESFGEPYKTETTFLRYMTGEGRLLCDQIRKEVVFVATRLPYVYGFSTDGELRWIAMIPEYLQMGLVEDRGTGAVQVGLVDEITQMHMLHSTALIGDSHILVQLGLYNEEAVEDALPAEIKSVVVDLSRRVIVPADNVKEGVVGFKSNKIVTFSNSPYPHLKVHTTNGAER